MNAWWKAVAVALAVDCTCAAPTAGASGAADDAASALALHGRLRACMGFGNPILAQRDPRSGDIRGITVDIARALGGRLGVPVEPVLLDRPGAVTEALLDETCDVGFQAIDPVRGERLAYTPAYVVFDGRFAVRRESSIATISDVDRDGVRIAVPQGSAYDLYLGRTLKHALLVRFDSGAAAVRAFDEGGLDAIAGAAVSEAAFAKRRPDLRLLPGRFLQIRQALAIPKSRDAALPYLRAFVEDLKASGFIARELAALGETDASVAPPDH